MRSIRSFRSIAEDGKEAPVVKAKSNPRPPVSTIRKQPVQPIVRTTDQGGTVLLGDDPNGLIRRRRASALKLGDDGKYLVAHADNTGFEDSHLQARYLSPNS